MLLKWKTILSNWIHCYLEEDTKKQFTVTLESLLNIISHLRENFNLDESNTSILDAHSIKEFILDKYPGIRFENGNLKPVNEEEVYLIASLLLYFVCVNSKDWDIKKAMCSKLCRADQEIILKFSKCLMDCPNITSTDVLSAIVEACGQDTAASDLGLNSVAETPPALRSLHSEVRRLQALLDAERFDKNYLQEELARTNIKLETLTKDKEQYKQDLIDLKAKISTCGQDDSVQGDTESVNNSVKLVKQLEQVEQRLVNVQEQLDDVQYERDIYKSKLDELKLERDKWIAISQEESSKACDLADQLGVERQNVQSLKDLVTELQQHNRLNDLDTSQLEWDDCNASMRSFQHNTSVCSEACANVIEVQLSEERAKVVLLKQQMQALQDQLNDLKNKFEEERLNYLEIISTKDNEIFILKHRINEEIEEKNNFKLQYDDDVTKLNNEVNELEQRLRGNSENSRRIIDCKMKEIQILQEEKLSLLESLTNKTTTLEDTIRSLKLDIDSEKTTKLKMREDYDNQLMKLNEKVLNRNNELVELQNRIFEKGEKIEQLQFDLRKEKDLKDEIIIKYNNDVTNLNKQIETYEFNFKCKQDEITNLKERIHECDVYNKQLEKDMEQLRSHLANYSDINKALEECKAKLVIELQNRDSQIYNIQNEKERLEYTHAEEKNKLQYNLDEINATTATLRMQLEDEIQFKISMQDKLHQSKITNENHTKSISDLNNQVTVLKADYNKMEQNLNTEREITARLKNDCEPLNKEIDILKTNVIEKDSIIKSTLESLSDAKIKFDEECRKEVKKIEQLQFDLRKEKDLKDEIIIKFNNDITNLNKQIETYEFNLKCKQDEITILKERIQESDVYNKQLEKDMEQLRSYLANYSDINKALEECKAKLVIELQNRDSQIYNIQNEKERLEYTHAEEKNKLQYNLDEINATTATLTMQLENEVHAKISVQDKLHQSIITNENLTKSISDLNNQVTVLKADYNKMEQNLNAEREITARLKNDCEALNKEIDKLKTNIIEKDSIIKSTLESLSEAKIKFDEEWRKEEKKIEQLQFDLRKEKDLKDEIIIKYNNDVTNLNKQIVTYEFNLKCKQDEIINLKERIQESDVYNKQLEKDMEQLRSYLANYSDIKKALEECKAKMVIELQNRDSQIYNTQNEKEQLEYTCAEEKNKLQYNLDEINATTATLTMQLENEVQAKISMQDELHQSIITNENLTKSISGLNNQVTVIKADYNKMEQNLNTERDITARLKNDCEALKKEIDKLKTNIIEKESLIKSTLESLSEAKIKFDVECREKDTDLELIKSKLEAAISNSDALKHSLDQLDVEKKELVKDIHDKECIIINLQKDIVNLSKKIEDNANVIDEFHKTIDDKKNAYMLLQKNFDTETTKLQVKLNETDKLLKEMKVEWNTKIETKEQEIETLRIDIGKLRASLEQEREKSSAIEQEKMLLIEQINEIKANKNKCEKEYLNMCALLNCSSTQFNEEIFKKSAEIDEFKKKMGDLVKSIGNRNEELMQQSDQQNTLLETKSRDIQQLKLENQTLRNELNDVKVQLDVKVNSLKEKLIDTENLTDKLKKTYECQIHNLNMMVTKVTNYLKEKTMELDSMTNEKEKLQQMIEENYGTIRHLEADLKNEKQYQEKLINDFESESLVLKNMITVTETVMKDQNVNLNKIIATHKKSIQSLEEEIKNLKQIIDTERIDAEIKLQKRKDGFDSIFKELSDVRKEKEIVEQDLISQKESFEKKQSELLEEITMKHSTIETLKAENKDINEKLKDQNKDIDLLNEKKNESKIKLDAMEVEFEDKIKTLNNNLDQRYKSVKNFEILLENQKEETSQLHDKLNQLEAQFVSLGQAKFEVDMENRNLLKLIDELNITIAKYTQENLISKNEIAELTKIKEDMNSNMLILEERLQLDKKKQEEYAEERANFTNKCTFLEERLAKAEMELEIRQKEISTLNEEVKVIKEEKDAIIKLNTNLMEEKDCLEDVKKQSDIKVAEIHALRKKLNPVKHEADTTKILKNENKKLINAIGQTVAVASYEKSNSQTSNKPTEYRDDHQVDTSSEYSSIESYKTICDLEKIIQDKNRTIATLQSDATYLKSLIAESETKCLDITKGLELSEENCQQLSSQLKKIVHHKNEEIADLKKQVSKMSAMENRATQIIKVSAKYQAIILKRIAEIKSNTVLKELTNFGNANCDSELRRSLTSGTITMEDLENFLETTDRHLHRCSEKRHALQRDKERLTEINRINESEIINMRKFLTELSVSIKTFNSVKDLYTQKLSRVVPLQRTVRREILSLDGHITDAVMGKLERGYSSVMQDLSECALNLERWMDRCVSRTMSSEKINQAFTIDSEHAPITSGSFQNTALEVQLEELQNSFQKLLAEVARAQNGEMASDTQSVTVMEVRAEYEDKLNRMKAKMKQLYQEQIAIFKEKQREEIMGMELELKKTQKKLHECEQHIKSLTTELWNVGEKYLMKKDEADWLRKKQHSGSLMSLQHVHSSGLVPPHEESSRQSDTLSLRSLPATNNNTKEGRGLHMSDEEGEVFTNRCLRELATTPRRESEVRPGNRISELRWRNSLCPPHLKSSYPAETQFAPAIHEEDIKCTGGANMSMGGKQRKEVGITAYKKPGPPTPSKQAGRLSATDSELRESLRIEAEPSASRKTSTPSRLRSLFRSNKNETTEGTPRSRRLSNIIFRKK